ncbi:hypothetical protein CLV58_109140 [Spirosoma oryzae]|uniref:Uncharacterized protein n=1 Tax=Spirosoma oryzae TaxID=1469603 RepID=A0A2T0SYH5_9BACT|nr:hypothetical protein [Spirosoma oryzae]PRY38413.1 hypothetical protein CLV58_109140 [Spirosoma oryzae]
MNTVAIAKPVVEVFDIRPTSEKNGVQNVSVGLRQIIEDSTTNSLMSLAFRRKGDESVSGGPKKLVFYVNMTQQAVDEGGFSIGVDINSLGHGGVYSIRETYRAKLDNKQAYTVNGVSIMCRPGLDGDKNVTIDPMSNPKTGEIMLVEDQLVFRNTELCFGKLEDLPASETKPTYDEYKLEPFEGETKVEGADGKKHKTPEYQAWLNQQYNERNEPGVTIPVAPELAVAA